MNKSEILELLKEIQDFLDNYIDIKDSDDGPVPNTAMILDYRIKELILELERENEDKDLLTILNRIDNSYK